MASLPRYFAFTKPELYWYKPTVPLGVYKVGKETESEVGDGQVASCPYVFQCFYIIPVINISTSMMILPTTSSIHSEWQLRCDG